MSTKDPKKKNTSSIPHSSTTHLLVHPGVFPADVVDIGIVDELLHKPIMGKGKEEEEGGKGADEPGQHALQEQAANQGKRELHPLLQLVLHLAAMVTDGLDPSDGSKT